MIRLKRAYSFFIAIVVLAIPIFTSATEVETCGGGTADANAENGIDISSGVCAVLKENVGSMSDRIFLASGGTILDIFSDIGTIQANGIYVSNGSTLNVYGDLGTVNGSIMLESGATMNVYGNIDDNSGGILLNDGASLSIYGNVTISSGGVDIKDNASLILNGGNLTVVSGTVKLDQSSSTLEYYNGSTLDIQDNSQKLDNGNSGAVNGDGSGNNILTNDWEGGNGSGNFPEAGGSPYSDSSSGAQVIIAESAGGTVTFESGITDSFDVVLASAPSANVTVDLSSDNTSEGDISPTSITFTTGDWNSAQTITVTPADDLIDDGPQFYFINTSTSSSDGNYGGLPTPNVGVLNKNDGQYPRIIISAPTLTTIENGTTQSFDLTLGDQPASGKIVQIDVTGLDATEGSLNATSFTFDEFNWNVAQAVEITPVDDNPVDGDIDYDLTLSVNTGAANHDSDFDGVSDKVVTVTNQDDETAGFTIDTSSTGNTSESGGSTTFTVVLDAEPLSNVVLRITSLDNTEGLISPSDPHDITFTPTDWFTAQTITVVGQDDVIADGAIAYQVRVRVRDVSSNNQFDPLPDQFVNITNVENVAPTALGGTYSTAEDTERYLTFTELGYSDVDGDTMEKIKISALPGTGVVFVDDVLVNGLYDVGEELQLDEEVTKAEIDAGIFGFLPAQDQNGNGIDSFGFQPHDGTEFSAGSATITFDVTAVNDPPTITVPANQVVNEDGDIQGIEFNVDEGGIADEDVQSLTVSITSSDQSIVQDANILHDFADNDISSADEDGPYFIDITPELEAFGEVTITITVQDNGTGSPLTVETFVLNVRPVNDMPSFTPGLDVTVIEDYGAYSEGWATDVSAGPANESSQVLNFVVTNDNNALFSVQPAISPDGTLTFTTSPDAFGVADVTVYLTDDGGRLFGGVDTSLDETFTLEITAQNDPPTGADQAVSMAVAPSAIPESYYQFNITDFSDQFQDVDLDDFAGIRIISSSVSGARLRYPDELTPLITIPINISDGNIDNLYFEIPESPAVMSFTFKVQDENGAFSTDNYTMYIVVGAASLPTANSITREIDEDTKYVFTTSEFETEYTHPEGVAFDAIKITSLETTGMLKFDGLDVTLNQVIYQSQLDLLTYQPAENENGSSYDSFDFTVLDAAENESASDYVYTFDVIPLNDAPTFVLGDDQFIYDDEGAQTISAFMTGQDDGDPDLSQNLTVVISNSDNSLFTVQPSIDLVSGDLTYTPADEAEGLAIVTVSLTDDGGTTNGGTDASEDQTFKITILDAPESTPTTIPAGSYIVDMGISPQTFENGLYPFGLIYDLTANYSVPISIAINFSKIKDGIDFSHEGVDYRGAPFIISAEYITPEIQDVITSWETNGSKVGGPGDAGIVGNYTTTDALNVPIYVTFSTFPKWTLDVLNGALVGQFFANALIPAEAYQTAYPYELDERDDIFVLPHADPTWDDHSNLYYWNQSLENGGQGGWIWAGCHAVSVMENLSNPIDPSEKMNFLSNPGLIPFDVPGHQDGTPPFSYRYPVHQFMQFMGTFDGATLNGSEQIYLPLLNGKWNASSQIAVYDADHADIPTNSPGEAAKMVFGPAFGDPSNGTVLYQGGHDLNGTGTEVEKVAAQRAFFNFSFLAPLSKVPTVSAFYVPQEMGQGQAYSLLVAGLARDGSSPTYEWRSSCGGSFDDITSPNPMFIAPVVASVTECIITVVITDDQGRQTFKSAVTTILPNEAPTFTSFSASVDNTLEEAQVEITFAELLAASDAEDEDGTIEKFIVQNVSTGTLVIGATSGTATPFDADTNNAIDIANNAYWTPDVDENATIDAFEVLVEDDAGLLSVGNVLVQVDVSPVNDEPSFTKGPDQVVNINEGPQSIANWATDLDKGAANESGQTLSFNVSNDNIGMFSTQPSIDASGTLTFEVGAGQTGMATVTVSVSDDGGVDDGGDDTSPDQTFTITVNSAPSVTAELLSGNTTEAGGTATFNVHLDAQPATDVVLNLSSTDTNEGVITSPTTLTFTNSNWSDDQTVTVTGQDDNVDDGDISYDIDIVVDDAASDNAYDGLSTSITIINEDDDAVGFSLSESTTQLTSEAGTNDSFDLVLDSEPASNVVIIVSSTDTSEGLINKMAGTASGSVEFTFTPGDWNVPQTVDIEGQDDITVDGTVSYTINLSVKDADSDNTYDPVSDQTINVDNADDEIAGFTASAISGNTTESGTAATFTVVLDAQPETDVVFTISSGNISEGTVNPSSLTFTNGNWNVAQTVTVTGINDDGDDGDITYNVTVAVDDTNSDDAFDPLVNQDVAVTNEDDDTAGFTITESDGTTETSETPTSTDSFTVVLDAQPLSDVVFDVTSGDTGEGTVDLGTLTFTNGNWDTPQTVTVTGIDDPTVDGDISYNVTVAVDDASSDDAFDGLTDNVSVTNTDDDTAAFTASAISGNTNETGTTATFTVVLDAQPLSDVVFDVTSGDTGEGTVDLGTLTFTNGNWDTPQTVTVTGIDDPTVDGDISYNVTVAVDDASSDDAFDGLTDNVSVTNTDDDTAAFTASAISGNTNETGTTATFTVVLDAQPLSDVVFDVTSGDTGEGTVDLGTLTFTNGNWDTPQTVTVTGIDDPTVDGDISYNVTVAVDDASSDDAFDGLTDNVSVTNTDDDTAAFTASAISGNTNETGTTATFTVVLDAQPLSDVVFDVTSGDTGEGTVDLGTLTFTNGNWDTPQTVTVTGVDDPTVDGDISYNVTVAVDDASSDDAFDGLTDNVSVTNTDDDVADFTASAISGNTNETGTTATFTVVLDAQPLSDVVFDVTSGDTGEGTVDLGTLTFTNANWNVAQTVTVTGVDDPTVDGDISYNVTVAVDDTSSDDAFDGLTDNVSVTNEDDDVADFTASAISGNTNETGTTATFTVVLDAQPLSDVVFDVTSGDTGEGTVDLGTLTFTNANWNVAQTITVTGVDDPTVDGDISYNVTVAVDDASSDDAFDGLTDNVSVTNTDDDVADFTASAISGNTNETGTTATFTVVLDAQPLSDVVFDVTSGDTGEGTVDLGTLTFTNANWNVAQTITVTGVDDPTVDGDISYNVTVAVDDASSDDAFDGLTDNVSVTNTDDDVADFTASAISGNTNETGTTATFTVVLDAQPLSDVVFDVTSGDTGEGTVDLGTLTFTNANWNVAQTITVTGVDDPTVDGDISYNVTVAVDDASSDDAFDGLTDNVSVTNADDDVADFTITETDGTTQTAESGTTDSFTVVLDAQPISNVVIDISVGDATEGTADKASLTFTNANWDTPQTVTITGQDESLVDGDITYDVDISVNPSSDAAFAGLADQVVSVTNADNDVAGFSVTESDGTTETDESGSSDTFEVVLDAQPENDVIINLVSGDETEGTLSSVSLTFTNADWDTPQTVTLTGVDDELVDGDVSFDVTLSVDSSSDAAFSSLDAQTVSVTNADDDVAAFVIAESGGSSATTEAGGTDTFTIVLEAQPTVDVIINLSSDNEGEVLVDPAFLTFTNLNWSQEQTVTVTGVDDDVDDHDQEVIITASIDPSSDATFTGLDDQTVTVTNVDDDAPGYTVDPVSGLSVQESGTTDSFTILLQSEPTADVVVDFASTNTNEGTVSPASFTFNASNWDQAQTITVTGVDDNFNDGDVDYLVELTAASTDPSYDGLDPIDVAVTTVDDDSPGLVVSNISGDISEEGTTATFTVRLASEPVNDVVLDLISQDETEGLLDDDQLVFTSANWDQTQVVTITGVDDNLVDGNVGFNVTITVDPLLSDDDYDAVEAEEITITNLDDDVASIVIIETDGSTQTGEEGMTSDSFDVVLTSEPVDNVILNLTNADDTEGTLDKSTLTFTSADWNMPQTVTVTAVDEEEFDDDIQYTITISLDASSDATYLAVADQVVTVTNIDDDEPAVIVARKGFSPNGDGKNDFWAIEGIEDYPGNTVKIFNRWGRMIKSYNNYDNETVKWSGESDFSGNQVEDGTYYFVLQVPNLKKPVSGYIVVSR